MKIGLLTSIGPTIDAFFPPIIERWHELGLAVATAASSPASTPQHRIIKSVTRNPSPVNVQAPGDIASWVKEEGVDVVITNTATASFLARIRRMPVPVLYFCHGLHWNEVRGVQNRVWQGLELLALRNTDGVIVINSDDEAWFQSKWQEQQVYRLAGGVGVPLANFPRSEMPPVEGKVELLWAGEFSERKRPWLAVEVIKQLLELGVPAQLTMCGDGPFFEQTRQQVEELDLVDAVSLVGPSSTVGEYLRESHGMLLTSTWEGLPRIGLEALAVGRPVFAFDVKGTRSLPDVFLAPDKDVLALASIIQDQASSNFENVQLVDPANLHPNRAADEIARFAELIVDESGRGK